MAFRRHVFVSGVKIQHEIRKALLLLVH